MLKEREVEDVNWQNEGVGRVTRRMERGRWIRRKVGSGSLSWTTRFNEGLSEAVLTSRISTSYGRGFKKTSGRRKSVAVMLHSYSRKSKCGATVGGSQAARCWSPSECGRLATLSSPPVSCLPLALRGGDGWMGLQHAQPALAKRQIKYLHFC